MIGEKKKVLIIGKSKKTCSFWGVSLPVDYAANKSTMMTGQIFSQWLLDWDKEVQLAKCHILLLCDNCSAHPPDAGESLTNITLHFFPLNTTAVLQPLDAGVTNVTKMHYRCTTGVESVSQS